MYKHLLLIAPNTRQTLEVQRHLAQKGISVTITDPKLAIRSDFELLRDQLSTHRYIATLHGTFFNTHQITEENMWVQFGENSPSMQESKKDAKKIAENLLQAVIHDLRSFS